MAFDVEGARKAGYSESEIADYLAKDSNFDAAGARKAGYSDAELITELTKPPAAPTSSSDTEVAALADVPGGGAAVKPAPDVIDKSREAWKTAAPVVVGGNAPGYVQSELLPLARRQDVINDPNAHWYQGWALAPGPLRALGQTPAENVTINPETGTMNLAPEALTAATVLGGTPGLRFSGKTPFVREPPGTLTRPLTPTVDEVAAAIQRADQPARNQLLQPEMSYQGPPGPARPGERPQPETAAPQPEPPPSIAAPQPAGAQVTPPGLAQISPKEVEAYRATSEGQKLLENQQTGIPDRNQYVAKVAPNAAELEQSVDIARELKSLGVTSTEASQEARAAAEANNSARVEHWQDTARSPVDLLRARAARQEQAQADLKATWANKTEADAQPVIDLANQIRTSPDGRRPAVRSALDSVTRELTDDNGRLITDPEMLYGVRKHIDDLLSKEGQRETPLAARATANLQALKDQLDTAIEAAAPGFRQYLKNFSEASKGIDEMQVLQDAEKNAGLFRGPQQQMRYSDFQRFMKNVVDMRGAQGVNPYKSLSDATMQRLWNLRDDLRRSASAMDLARAPGSDTAPIISDVLKRYAKLGGVAGAHAVANAISPGWGSIAVRGLQEATAPFRGARAARQQQQRAQELLYPPQRNQLLEP